MRAGDSHRRILKDRRDAARIVDHRRGARRQRHVELVSHQLLCADLTEAAGGFTPQAVTQILSVVMLSVAAQPRWTAVPRAVATNVESSAFALRMFCFSRPFCRRGKPIAKITPATTNTNISSMRLNPLRPMGPPLGGSYYTIRAEA